MEVARSHMANPSLVEAGAGCPAGARDAADGFSQISTRDLKPSAATTPAAALGNGSHSSSSRLFSLRIRRRYKQVRPSDPQRLRLSSSARSLAIPCLPYLPVGAELCRYTVRVYESTHNTNYPQQNTPSGTREHLS